MALKVGDVVACKSTNRGIFFKIQEIVTTDSGETRASLLGLDVRLCVDSPVEDLVKVEGDRLREYRKRFIRQNNECLRKIFTRRIKEQRMNIGQVKNKSPGDFFEIPGRVLHIDGNLDYLKLCLGIYEQLGITAEGLFVPEGKQPASVPELIRKLKPDILVLTGHDGMVKSTEAFKDLSNYYNSKYFVAGVEAAREVECDKDNLVIFAGACQSHYEALISAGANYATSPMRVLIHAFDPVFIVEKIAFTHISQTVSTNEVIANTIAGLGSLGGIETMGKYRKGFPKLAY